MVLNFERAWSFQLFKRKLRNFSKLQAQDQMVCLVPADPIQREIYRFKRMFDLSQAGLDPDQMDEDEEFEERRQKTRTILGGVTL